MSVLPLGLVWSKLACCTPSARGVPLGPLAWSIWPMATTCERVVCRLLGCRDLVDKTQGPGPQRRFRIHPKSSGQVCTGRKGPRLPRSTVDRSASSVSPLDPLSGSALVEDRSEHGRLRSELRSSVSGIRSPEDLPARPIRPFAGAWQRERAPGECRRDAVCDARSTLFLAL